MAKYNYSLDIICIDYTEKKKKKNRSRTKDFFEIVTGVEVLFSSCCCILTKGLAVVKRFHIDTTVKEF